jgi:hypothetical protein
MGNAIVDIARSVRVDVRCATEGPRRRAASIVRRAAWSGFHAYERARARIAASPAALRDALLRLSGCLAGCGCTSDSAEMCDHGDDGWCYCWCHDENASERAQDPGGSR